MSDRATCHQDPESAAAHPSDRVAYARGKAELVARVMERAKRHYGRA